ncbi:MAG: DMT family transporter [Clostridia bacterium]|nr:DMT family transporter [Clostridia bacterium]
MKFRLKNTISAALLVLTALIWGVAFVAQSVGSEHVGPFTFLASRSLIAGVALLPLIAFRRRTSPGPKTPADRKNLWIGGLLCGCALTVASAFQQIGIAETTVGKAGFITALYIVIVPLFGLFLKKRVPLMVWLGVVLAAVGMYLLCITEGFSISRGDFFVLLCAACYSVHILVIDHFSPRVDGVRMACIQFFTCGILSGIVMLIAEKPTADVLVAAWLPILYAGLLSSGVGYTLQIVAQKNVPPTIASLLMSLESVFSVLAGWVLLGQALSLRELLGCVLVFAAILLAQLPENLFSRHR